jgi:hypothetical protein
MSSIILNHASRQQRAVKSAISQGARMFSGVVNNDGVGGTIVQSGVDARNKGTLQYQNTLPKMPIPPLEDTMARYLERTLPYLSPEQQVKTRASVKAFLDGDGPILHKKLLDYDKKKV